MWSGREFELLHKTNGAVFENKTGAFAACKAVIIAGSDNREISTKIPNRFISWSTDWIDRKKLFKFF